MFQVARPVLGVLYETPACQQRTQNCVSCIVAAAESLASGSSGPYQPTTRTSGPSSLGVVDCPFFSTSPFRASPFCISASDPLMWPLLRSDSWACCECRGSCDGVRWTALFHRDGSISSGYLNMPLRETHRTSWPKMVLCMWSCMTGGVFVSPMGSRQETACQAES